MADPCATCGHEESLHSTEVPHYCDCMSFVSPESGPDPTAKALWRREHGELSMAVGAAAVTWWESAQNYDPDEDEVWQRLIRDVSDERMRELLLDEYLMNRFRSQQFRDLQTAIGNLAQHAQHPPLPTGGMTTDERMAKVRQSWEQSEVEAQARRDQYERAVDHSLVDQVVERGLVGAIVELHRAEAREARARRRRRAADAERMAKEVGC